MTPKCHGTSFQVRRTEHSVLNIAALATLAILLAATTLADDASNARKPKNDDELRFWLDNMLVHHRLTPEEAAAATGMKAEEITAAAKRLEIGAKKLWEASPVFVLPYPGGRHPRIGFLDGAVNPQRETKVSVFAPWTGGGYAVVDVPEAIWHESPSPPVGEGPGVRGNRSLLYLAHTHVPTIWDKQGIKLEPLEWQQIKNGWTIERTLPNKVAFGTRVNPRSDHVRMEMWLTNGTTETFRGLVVQNCVMLKGLTGFEQQTNDNKLFQKPYALCHNSDKNRWIITAWEPCQRAWANPPCPCLHSDPQFPDAAPGKTVHLRGWLSFYEGKDIEAEIKRIEVLGWNTAKGNK